jgi:hypothetical protein
MNIPFETYVFDWFVRETKTPPVFPSIGRLSRERPATLAMLRQNWAARINSTALECWTLIASFPVAFDRYPFERG